jgi:hypothetical protein
VFFDTLSREGKGEGVIEAPHPDLFPGGEKELKVKEIYK